jgi:hypothetical protein
MIPILDLIFLAIIHYIGDFVCQTRYMANNKSKHVKVLISHVLTYTACVAISYMWIWKIVDVLNCEVYHSYIPGLFFIFVNMSLHFITDFCTSKLTSYYYERGKERPFFLVIGLDQLIHIVTFYITYYYIMLPNFLFGNYSLLN